MKIAISGSGGIGKSTLSKNLANKFNIALIEENYAALNASDDQKAPHQKLFQIFETKLVLENEHSSFVTDRCPLDLMNTWLSRGLHTRNVPSAKFIRQCTEHCSRYDFVIIPPWNSFPLEQATQSLPRNMNKLGQMRQHASILGLAHIWIDPEKIIEIPKSMNELEERIKYVSSIIQSKSQSQVSE